MNTPAPFMPRNPMLPLLAAFAGGEVCAWLLPGMLIYGAAFMAALCFLCAMRKWRAGAGMSLFFVAGMCAMAQALPRQPEDDLFGRKLLLHGFVEEVISSGETHRAVVDVAEGGAEQRILLVCRGDDVRPEAGDSIVFEGVLRRIGDGECVPGEMSFRGFADRRGIVAECVAEAGEVETEGHRETVWMRLASMREGVSDYICYRSGLSQPCAAMLEAVLLGNSGVLDEGVWERFAIAGSAHVLALSGMHVGLIAFLAALVFMPLRTISGGGHRMALVCTIGLLWGYALLTGCSPSVVRAVVMASFVMAGRLAGRGTSPFNNLCVAGMFILFVDPMALFAAGFQLSFAAVAAILLFAFELQPVWGVRSRWGRALLSWLTVCVSAVAGTAMLAAWHFHRLPVYFLIADFVLTMLLPWFMGLGALLLLCQLAGLPSDLIVEAVETIYLCMERVTAFMAGLPGASLEGIYFSGWLLLPYYMALWAAWMWLRSRRAVYGLCCGMLAVFTGVMLAMRPVVPLSEAYAMKSDYSTVVLLRNGHDAWLLTDAPAKFHRGMQRHFSRRLAGWMAPRGVDSLKIVTPQSEEVVYAPGAFYVSADRWALGDKEVVPVWGEADSIAVPVAASGAGIRYALICRGFKGDVADVWNVLRPDTIVLSRSLHPSAVKRIADDMLDAEIPFRIGIEGVCLMENQQ